MNTITKTIIFLVIAFIIVISLTFASAPSTNTSSSTPTTVTTNPETAKTYTLADVAKHAVKTDCWTTINGSVYNLTSFIPSHPGGERITVVCGKDGTAAFEGQHDSQQNPNMVLASLKIGTLAK